MSEPKHYEVTTSDGFVLPMTRHLGKDPPKASVLLIHGASAASSTFLIPKGNSLVDSLLREGLEVWLMDWRGSKEIVDKLPDDRAGYEAHNDSERYDMESVARWDFPAALRLIRSTIKESGHERPLHVVAHCLGAGSFAVALALGSVTEFEIDRVVLSTLGLFYQAPWDGLLKAEDRIIERLPTSCMKIDPREFDVWPLEMRKARNAWPEALLPACGNEVCEHLAFMFGPVYFEKNLVPSIHEEELKNQFGSMHVTLYKHAGQNLRRGFAAPYDAPPSGDAALIRRYLNPDPFRHLRITLITGAQNTLWHRDSIDRMYDWLRAIDPSGRYQKHVFPNYGHQDLLWGQSASKEVFPKILAALV